MYAVILAGGGGTRLWPLSRPERPKPFLPLLGDETLLQATVRRLAPARDRRHHGRHRPALRRAGPRADARRADPVVEPMGRNTAAAIALATLAIERPRRRGDGRAAGRPPDRSGARGRLPRASWPRPPTGLATGAFDIEDPLVTLGIQVDHPATEYGYLIPDSMRGEASRAACGPTRSRAFEEKPQPARARGAVQGRRASPGTRACSCGGGGAILAALEKYTGAAPARSARWSAARRCSSARTSRSSRRLDRLRGDGGRGRRRPGRDGLDGRRLERPRRLVGAAGGARGDAASGRGRPGRRDRRGRPRTTCSSAAIDGRLGVIAPPERGYDDRGAADRASCAGPARDRADRRRRSSTAAPQPEDRA